MAGAYRVTDDDLSLSPAFIHSSLIKMLMFILSTAYDINAAPKKIISLNDLNHAYRILRRNVGHLLLGGWSDSQLHILVFCRLLCLRERQW